MCGGSPGYPCPAQAAPGLSPRVRGKRFDGLERPCPARSIPACAGEAPPQPAGRLAHLVYPRVCGGSAAPAGLHQCGGGLSPRVRGKQAVGVQGNPRLRSIPACAGEAGSAIAISLSVRVYPRVCGGSWRRRRPSFACRGLSPRVRGKQRVLLRAMRRQRSIPACAGEARRPAFSAATKRVYPRVCGGSGSRAGHQRQCGGLSPRVRGKRRGDGTGAQLGRSIPACAGEARSRPPMRCSWPVYPRVCGGSQSPRPIGIHRAGLSPRVRGKQTNANDYSLPDGSIPACAGEATGAGAADSYDAVYPRVCGGSSAAGMQTSPPRGLSPRVRGKRAMMLRNCRRIRSIPACAGEAITCRASGWPLSVYPRVCGGSFRAIRAPCLRIGLSPRVRGKHQVLRGNRRNARSIPACAGEAP